MIRRHPTSDDPTIFGREQRDKKKTTRAFIFDQFTINFKYDRVNAHKGIFDQKGISYFIFYILFRYDSFRRKHHIQGLPEYSGN